MTYICNPLNIEYKYQFVDTAGTMVVFKGAADWTLGCIQSSLAKGNQYAKIVLLSYDPKNDRVGT